MQQNFPPLPSLLTSGLFPCTGRHLPNITASRTLLMAFLLAPQLSSSDATSLCPDCAARWSGVLPEYWGGGVWIDEAATARDQGSLGVKWDRHY